MLNFRRLDGPTISNQAGLGFVSYSVFEPDGEGIESIHRDDERDAEMETILEDGFQAIIDAARNDLLSLIPQQVDGIPVMGCKIDGQTEDLRQVTIHISYRPYPDLTGHVILENIERVLNSSESLLTTMTMKFSIRWRALQVLEGGIKWRGDPNWFVKNKRCIVEITPEDDKINAELKNCFYQFLALGIAQRVTKEQFSERDQLPLRLGITKETYPKLTSGRPRYKLRMELAEKIQRLLSSLPTMDMREMNQYFYDVEVLLGIRICLYSFHGKISLEYPNIQTLPYDTPAPTLYGLIVTSETGVFHHVHFLSNPSALTLSSHSSRICPLCFVHYVRNRSCNNELCENKSSDGNCAFCHECQGVCQSCRTKDCGRVIPTSEDRFRPFLHESRCINCNCIFFSEECKTLHETVCRKQFIKLCELGCGRNAHRGFHCNETKCMLCGEKILIQSKVTHQCYLRRQKLATPSINYWSYDVETALDAKKRHQLYLIIAWPLYALPYLDELRNKYPYQIHANDPSRPFFIFWGLEKVYEFFDFVCDPLLNGSQFFAHNSGRYDSIFVENYMLQNKKLNCNKIERGLKILQMSFEQIDVTFKDSLNFIPTALRSMSDDFGIEEVAKGFFPHNLVTVEKLKEFERTGFWIPRPGEADYPNDFSNTKAGKKEAAEFKDFLKLENDNPIRNWNLKDHAIMYCISDVKLLGETLILFREKTMGLTKNIPRDESVDFKEFDPLQYVTLPSAVMKFYLSQLLPEKTIGVIDSFQISFEKEQQEWLYWESYHNNVEIVKMKEIDGISISGMSSNAIFRYINCYMSGCERHQTSQGWNIRSSRTFKQCYLTTKYENQVLREKNRGKLVKVMWSCKWLSKCNEYDTKSWLRENDDQIQEILPLDPREAYKGGITEVFKLLCQKKGTILDYVSQYPTSLLGSSYSPISGEKVTWNMPIGQPIRIIEPEQYDFTFLGVSKCKIIPPDDLYAPLLGYASPSIVYPGTTETLYGLCKTCMDTRNWNSCDHTDDERAFIGTWTNSELHCALNMGYRIVKIYEVWEYQQSSSSLFRNFIIPFMITKICCKKDELVENDEFTAKGIEIRDYVREIAQQELSPQDFKNSPSERTIAKLIMNSFYGKWGQRSAFPETRSFEEDDETSMIQCKRLLSDNDVNIDFGQIVELEDSRRMIYLEYTRKKVVLRGDKFKNDLIAAHVTAYGRIMLIQALYHASKVFRYGYNVIGYVDTDSIQMIEPESPIFQTGFRIGDLEHEEDIECAVWMKRKSYAYKTIQGKNIIKQKGIAIRQSHVQAFTYEKLIRLIQDSYEKYQEQIEAGESRYEVMKKMRVNKNKEFPTIVVKQVNFVTERTSVNPLQAEKKTVVSDKHTFSGIIDAKRVPRFDRWKAENNGILDTLPFGYKTETFY